MLCGGLRSVTLHSLRYAIDATIKGSLEYKLMICAGNVRTAVLVTGQNKMFINI